MFGAGLILFWPWLPSFLAFFFDIGRGVYAGTNSAGADSPSLYGIVQDSFLFSRPLMRGMIAVDNRLSADLLLLPSENTGLFGGRQIDLLANYASPAVGLILLAGLAWHVRHFEQRGSLRQTPLEMICHFAAGTCIMLLVPPFSWVYRTLWSLVFLLFLFVLVEQRPVPWLHFFVAASAATLLTVYLPEVWETLLAVVFLALYALMRFRSRPWNITTTLTTCLLLAFMLNLPFGKAWLLCLLTFFFFLEAPVLLAGQSGNLSSPAAGGRPSGKLQETGGIP